MQLQQNSLGCFYNLALIDNLRVIPALHLAYLEFSESITYQAGVTDF